MLWRVLGVYDVGVCEEERVFVRLLGRGQCISNETCPIIIYVGLNILYKSGLTIILML